METVDIRQQELDMVEKQVLTDIFGGYSSNNLVYRFGFLKLDLSPKVQKIIKDFEGFVKPLMSEDGYIDSAEIKKFVNEQIVVIPDGKYRLIEVYKKIQPFLFSVLKYFK
jgi:hypothetical protein